VICFCLQHLFDININLDPTLKALLKDQPIKLNPKLFVYNVSLLPCVMPCNYYKTQPAAKGKRTCKDLKDQKRHNDSNMDLCDFLKDRKGCSDSIIDVSNILKNHKIRNDLPIWREYAIENLVLLFNRLSPFGRQTT
jgi:hypothetical protein